MGGSPGPVTILLNRVEQGEPDALAELIPLVYKELRRLAGHFMRKSVWAILCSPPPSFTRPTCTCSDRSETGWQNRAQFLAIAAQIMRRILLQYARRRGAGKRMQPPPDKPALPADTRAMGRNTRRRRCPQPARRVGSAAGAHRRDAVFRRLVGGRNRGGARRFSADREARVVCGEGLVERAAFRRTARMTAERWALITSVFQAASERPVAERIAYLDEACRGDELLRRSVERLLAGEAEPSLRSPAGRLLEAGVAALAPGDTLAQYRVEARIGEGGMGAVYEAYDTRLHRKVALKVLRPEHFGDPDRLARLMREARAASALNHPNIVTIYEIGSDFGVDFIALEFVPGNTLARLVGRKGLPLRDALKYASQIADALAAAHRAGIVHRDLKPDNIVVTAAGQVKVLDFGLAKWTEPAPSGEPGFTVTMGQPTDIGTVLGTPAYMSPGAGRGKEPGCPFGYLQFRRRAV